MRVLASAFISAIAVFCLYQFLVSYLVTATIPVSEEGIAQRLPDETTRIAENSYDDLNAAEVFEFYRVPTAPVPPMLCILPVIDPPIISKVDLRPPDFVPLDIRPLMIAKSDCRMSKPEPNFPPNFIRGQYSGYCRLTYTFDETGHTSDIQAVLCTDHSLRQNSVDQVRSWMTDPGCINPAERLKTTIRFDIVDEDGQTLPLPPGF